MLLADRLIEAAASGKWPSYMGDDFHYVAGKIKSAQRFLVSEDVRGAIAALLCSKPTTLIEASRFAKLPFDRCWFEWDAPAVPNLHPGQVTVRRCGALMENYGPHGFTVWTAWEYDHDSFCARAISDYPDMAEIVEKLPPYNMSSLVGAYDLSSMVAPPIMLSDRAGPERWFQTTPLTSESLNSLRDDERNGIRHVLKNPTEFAALQALAGRVCFRVHWETHGERKISAQWLDSGDTSSVLHDVQDEMGHLLATLVLMNSKNCIQVAPTVPDEKLNKARRKRGKVELLPYSTVSIELTQSQQRAVDSGRISREEARRHLVRGHFKVRATGVFWWGQFMRGSLAHGAVERKAHVIEAGH
jgi:hypothetical protein